MSFTTAGAWAKCIGAVWLKRLGSRATGWSSCPRYLPRVRPWLLVQRVTPPCCACWPWKTTASSPTRARCWSPVQRAGLAAWQLPCWANWVTRSWLPRAKQVKRLTLNHWVLPASWTAPCFPTPANRFKKNVGRRWWMRWAHTPLPMRWRRRATVVWWRLAGWPRAWIYRRR